MADAAPPLPTDPQNGNSGTEKDTNNQGGTSVDPPPPIPEGGGNEGGGVDPPPPIPPPKPDGKHGRPEQPNGSVWYTVDTPKREDLRGAATRVVEMLTPSSSGGVQAYEHAGTKTSTLNNRKSVDWAIWELLIMLEKCGYAGRPKQ